MEELLSYIRKLAQKDIMVAFSGGVDSSLLVKLAVEETKKQGNRVYAVLVKTMLHPVSEETEAKKTCEELGAVFLVEHVDELAEAGIEDNPVDRCYHCKKTIFLKLLKIMKQLGAGVLLDGTNASDLLQYRPGIRALQELHVVSPFARFGITKEQIREEAEKRGISVANKPAMPCMATRFPYGTSLTYEMIQRVEQAEQEIRELGFYNVRLRVHQDIARIEVDVCDLEKAVAAKDHIIEIADRFGYTYVCLDLMGFRSGSMDVHIAK